MHVIKYKWNSVGDSLQPFLFFHNGTEIKIAPLLGEQINFHIKERICIGYFKNGRHIICPNRIQLEDEYNCNSCRLNDDFFMCIKCDGSECINIKQRHACSEEIFFVYLAAFDSILKVGISRERRLLERLIEQGADFGAKVACVKDGKDVRIVEQKIRSHLKAVDKVRGSDKQSRIFCNPNTALASIYSAISKLRDNGFNHYLLKPEIFDLRNFYGLQNVPYTPKKMKVKSGTNVNGKIIAAKGPVLIIKDCERLFSINAHDLIGREIEL